MKITFFGTQPYDRESFDRANERYGFEFNYHRSHLNGNNTSLAQGADAVCIFVMSCSVIFVSSFPDSGQLGPKWLNALQRWI